MGIEKQSQTFLTVSINGLDARYTLGADRNTNCPMLMISSISEIFIKIIDVPSLNLLKIFLSEELRSLREVVDFLLKNNLVQTTDIFRLENLNY